MKNQKGFSFIELLIVLAIIGIIAATVISAVQRARQIAAHIDGKQTEEPDLPSGQILRGEHPLKKMFASSYFLNAGTKVTFAWPLKDGTYAISSLPIEKIRVKFDESVEVPTIRFCWTRSNEYQVDYLMANAVLYAVITVPEKEWPTQIQLPLNDPLPN